MTRRPDISFSPCPLADIHSQLFHMLLTKDRLPFFLIWLLLPFLYHKELWCYVGTSISLLFQSLTILLVDLIYPTQLSRRSKSFFAITTMWCMGDSTSFWLYLVFLPAYLYSCLATTQHPFLVKSMSIGNIFWSDHNMIHCTLSLLFLAKEPGLGD